MSNPASWTQQTGFPRNYNLASHLVEDYMQVLGKAQKPESLFLPFTFTASQDLCPGTWGISV